MRIGITSVKLSKTSFLNDWKKLPENVKSEGGKRIASLVSNGGEPKKLRLHALNGFHPKIYKIDLESGKGKRFQATFQIEDALPCSCAPVPTSRSTKAPTSRAFVV